MKDIRKRKLWLDGAILLLSFLWIFIAWYLGLPKWVVQVSAVLTVLIGGTAAVDWLKQVQNAAPVSLEQAAGFAAYELILLNETEKPIRAWDLTGRTAMIIGRKGEDMDVDVDLSDCEYSALINIQHAIMNYCLDSWYIEDPGSQNGIQIKKVEDGKCYQVAPHRPCKVSTGDIIYIAKTKILFT